MRSENLLDLVGVSMGNSGAGNVLWVKKMGDIIRKKLLPFAVFRRA